MPESKTCSETHRRLIERIGAQALDVERLTAGLHENHLSKHVVPNRWSLKQLTCHVCRVQQVFVAERLNLMLSQDNPELAPYDPDADPGFASMVEQPTTATVASFLSERAKLIERLKALTPEQWHRPGRHPVYALGDVYSMAEYLAHHESHHIYQMYQRRALLGPVPE
jgi:hypothetical protein